MMGSGEMLELENMETSDPEHFFHHIVTMVFKARLNSGRIGFLFTESEIAPGADRGSGVLGNPAG